MNNLLEKQFVTTTINKAVHNFLYQIGLLSQQNLFDRSAPKDFRIQYGRNNAFFLINPNYDNDSFVSSEKYLEGCIRVFLVNPIIKALLDHFGYRNDWMFGDTFNDFSITNREFELGAFVEFIFVCDGKAIGCRYTHPGYSSHEDAARDRNFRYEYKKEKIPGFNNINTVDFIYNIDWSGITSSELETIHRLPPEIHSRHKDIALEDFFSLFFSRDSYLIFLEECKKAISRAKAILSVKAVPQLMPTNMLAFKDSVLKEFSKDRIKSKNYLFNSANQLGQLTEEDLNIIDSAFFEDGLFEAIIGTSQFSKSFITSEYLFRTIDKRLEIDYTTVVAGYLKSVEQLLYLLYLSAFGNDFGIMYWDVCNKTESFDLSSEKYRYDPYCQNGKPELQEFYYHRKRTGVKAPTIGSLIHFIRYNSDTWKISEVGKEYVCSCLEDYRSFCRNHHFHKDNIERENYESVVRIRNNTLVCLYYLLGGFVFLKCMGSNDVKETLGIKDYSFERLFNSIPRKRGLWHIKTADGCERTGFFSILDYDPDNDRSDPKNIQISFIESNENDFWDHPNEIMFDVDYLSSHRVILTSDLMPIELTHIRRPRREKKQ